MSLAERGDMMDDYTTMRDIKDRVTRIETRLTRYMEHQGFDTQYRRPEWRNGSVEVPSMACSLVDVMRSIPEGWGDKLVDVTHKGTTVMQVYVGGWPSS